MIWSALAEQASPLAGRPLDVKKKQCKAAPRVAPAIRGGTQITAPGAADAIKRMVDLGIVGNGTDGVYGSFDNARVQALITDVMPVFANRGKPAKAGLQPSDLVTHEFLDKGVKL